MARKNNYLKANPEETFRMRFGKKHAKKIVELVNKKADEEDRTFPSAIERIIVEYYGLK